MSDQQRRGRIAVVDDEASTRALIRRTLEDARFEVLEGESGAEAIALAESAEPPGLMFLDMRLPGVSGLEALEAISKLSAPPQVILLTGYVDVRDAIAAIKLGARDYIEKPIDLDELVALSEEALSLQSESRNPDGLELELPESVVASSAALRAVFYEAHRVAKVDVPVLIEGESGSGKEVLARFLHHCGQRKDGPYVAVNCAALPAHLIESELFGHVKGAFTGATTDRKGRFEEAKGGVLLLDEIGEMPLELQPKLLRVLEERQIRRVGGSEDIGVDTQIIAATNRILEEEVAEGRFREDLLYRLNVVTLTVPPLRDRPEDVLPLAESTAKHFGKRLSPAAQRQLVCHNWPGNVRELRNAVTRASIVARGASILPDDLPAKLRKQIKPEAATTHASSLAGSMEEIQKRAILRALRKNDGNKTKAAKALGISRRNLIYKLRSYGL